MYRPKILISATTWLRGLVEAEGAVRHYHKIDGVQIPEQIKLSPTSRVQRLVETRELADSWWWLDITSDGGDGELGGC